MAPRRSVSSPKISSTWCDWSRIFDDLVGEVADGVVVEPEAVLLGELRLKLKRLRVVEAAGGDQVARLLGNLVVAAAVLLEHALHVQLDLAAALCRDLDELLVDQHLDDALGDRGNTFFEQPHADLLSHLLEEGRGPYHYPLPLEVRSFR